LYLRPLPHGHGQFPPISVMAHPLILRGPLSLLSAANAAVCRRVLAVGRTGLLAGSSSACLGRALRKYDAASSGCPCPHPRRYPCHDPCRSPVRQRTRIGIRIGTRIRMAHRHCRRPFLARSSCRGQRLRFAACVLARRQQRPCSPLYFPSWASDGRPQMPSWTTTYGIDWPRAGNRLPLVDT